jgi:hypothetical protein
MDDFDVQIIPTESLPPGISGASAFVEKIHYIFINVNLSEELQQLALQQEQVRKPY